MSVEEQQLKDEFDRLFNILMSTEKERDRYRSALKYIAGLEETSASEGDVVGHRRMKFTRPYEIAKEALTPQPKEGE